MYVTDIDISDEAKKIIKDLGINELYPPQEESIDDVISGENCVLAYPTASGKSLLAYISIIKRVLEEGGKALYIVPLRALASEKYEELKMFEELGIKIALSMGDYDKPDPDLKEYDVIVSTSEKADSLLRHNVEWLGNLNAVIADELHLINDRDRGSTLEVTLTKLKKVNPDAQIIALSATIRNSDVLADWLDARHHKSEWRPVILHEGVFDKNDQRIHFKNSDDTEIDGSDEIKALSVPTIEDGDQCLVFVSTRRSTEYVSQYMSGIIEDYLTSDEEEELRKVSSEIIDNSTTSIGEKLAEMVKKGTAFHNAGLNNFQRKMVERAFKDRLIKLIAATPTLAAGINMPARRVIIRDLKRYDPLLGYNRPIPILDVKQMSGRAGRPGYDDVGEAILVANSEATAYNIFEEYILGEPEVIMSRMATEPSLRRHLLALIATGHCGCEDEIYEFMEGTFYAQQSEIWMVEERIEKTMKLLESKELIERTEDNIEATRFGKRVSDLYIDPLSAVEIKNAVDRGKMGIPLSYLQTISSTPDMYPLYIKKTEVPRYRKKAESVRADLFTDIPKDPGDLEDFLTSFKTACLLKDWMDEVPEDEIAERYSVGPGDIRNKVDTAEWLLHSAAEIARLYNRQKEELLRELTSRIKHGIKSELLPLMELEQVGRKRARTFFDAGYRTPTEVRNASKEELQKLPGIGVKISSKVEEEEEDNGQATLKDY